MVGKSKAFDNDYKSKLADAVENMKTSELQKFFDKHDKGLSIIYKKSKETERKRILCNIIVQTKKYKGTKQFEKATKFLARHKEQK